MPLLLEAKMREPLIAPEFVLNKSLSASGSSAYAIPTGGDWTWAIIANTGDRMCSQLPELVLRNKDPKTCNGDIWRPPSGKWLKQGWTHFELTRSVRGIEVSLMWMVRHWRRVIRFYQPLLIDIFASRGETLVPVSGE